MQLDHRQSLAVALILLASILLIDNVNAAQDFTISANPTSITFDAGFSASSTITLTSTGGFSGTVTLTTTVSPSGLSCFVSPNSVSLSTTATATLSCNGSTPRTFTVVVNATSGALIHWTTVTVNVRDFTISATPNVLTVNAGDTGISTITVTSVNGFAGTVTFTQSITPSGLACFLSQTSVTLGASASSTLSCSDSAGTYTVTITGTSGSLSHTAVVIFTVQDFTIVAGQTAIAVDAGATGTSIIIVAAVNGFTGTVGLTQSVSPTTGITCSLTTSTVVLGISVTSNLSCIGSAGVYTVTVTGTSGFLSRTTTVTFTIEDFIMVASTNGVAVNAGDSGADTIIAVSLNGLSGTVTLVSTISPSTGLTCLLTPTSITLGIFGTATLSCNGPAGTYIVTVKGSSGSLSHSASMTYTVQDFTINASPTTLSFNTGTTTTTAISLTGVNGFSGTVNLATNVSPSGLTCSMTPSTVNLANSATSTLSCMGSTAGSYTVTVTGTSGSLTETASVTVAVTVPPSQSINVFYFAMVALAIGSGGATTVIVRKFNATDAPFDELFKLTGGEFQPPATVLIIGDPGAGTTTLGLQLIHQQLIAGKYCGLLTYDAFPSEVQKKMQEMGWDLASHLKDGTLRIIDCYSALAGDEKAPIRDPVDFTEISIAVTDIMDKAARGPITLLLDSITPIFNSANPRSAINFLRVLGAKVKNRRGVFILTGTKGSIPEEVKSNMEAMADGVIELNLVKGGMSVKRTLTVKKIAGHEASSAPSEFRIVSGKGILFRKKRISLWGSRKN